MSWLIAGPGVEGREREGEPPLSSSRPGTVLSGRLEGPPPLDGANSHKCSPFDPGSLAGKLLVPVRPGLLQCAAVDEDQKKAGKQARASLYFASRYMPRTILLHRHGQRIHLQEIGPKQEGACLQQVAVLAQEGLVVRLLMQRVPESVAKARQQRIREAASDHGREPDAGNVGVGRTGRL